MENGFMTDWVTPWSLWPSKIPRLKVIWRYTGFLSLKVNVLSIQSVLLSCYAALLEHQQVSWTFSIQDTIKVVTKVENKYQAF